MKQDIFSKRNQVFKMLAFIFMITITFTSCHGINPSLVSSQSMAEAASDTEKPPNGALSYTLGIAFTTPSHWYADDDGMIACCNIEYYGNAVLSLQQLKEPVSPETWGKSRFLQYLSDKIEYETTYGYAQYIDFYTDYKEILLPNQKKALRACMQVSEGYRADQQLNFYDAAVYLIPVTESQTLLGVGLHRDDSFAAQQEMDEIVQTITAAPNSLPGEYTFPEEDDFYSDYDRIDFHNLYHYKIG